MFSILLGYESLTAGLIGGGVLIIVSVFITGSN
jgi:uncharacterized membrane protein